jgi:vacuolar-type H+-ATPase subunit C/Vma6
MTGAGRYAELAAAVRSFKAELMQPSQLDRLLETGSLAETVSAITGGHITSTEGADLSEVEGYLIGAVIELVERLASYAPQDSRPLITLFRKSFEFGCVKAILNAIAAKVSAEEAMRYIIPAGKFTADRCKDLIESHNLNRVIESIEDESFKRFLAPKLTGEGAGIQTIASIDQYYFMKLWAASNLPDPLDAQSARGLIGEAIDHTNILITFRSRLMGLDARTASALMVPVNYGLGQAFDELPEANNAQNLARIIEKTRYSGVFESNTALDVARVEFALDRSHAKTCLNTFAGSPFNVGLALAFLFLKNYELKDLFGVINAKANNVPIDRTLESLILHQT